MVTILLLLLRALDFTVTYSGVDPCMSLHLHVYEKDRLELVDRARNSNPQSAIAVAKHPHMPLEPGFNSMLENSF